MNQMKHVLEMSLKESKENSALAVNEDEDLQRAIDARYGNHLLRKIGFIFTAVRRSQEQAVLFYFVRRFWSRASNGNKC